METLNEQDLDWLTKATNRLIRMRRREAANTKSGLVDDSLRDAIKGVGETREWLAGRLNVKVDSIPFDY